MIDPTHEMHIHIVGTAAFIVLGDKFERATIARFLCFLSAALHMVLAIATGIGWAFA